MIYKTFYKVSNVCQLLDKRKYFPTKTINGVTFTNNGDGTITANGTATAEANFTLSTFRTLAAHKYLLIGSPANGSNATYYLGGNYTRDLGAGIIASGGNASNCVCCVTKDCTANNLVFKPQLFDLTEMYGAGNEPTTVEQFRQDFPEEMYDYSPHCFVKSYKTVLKANDYCQFIKPNLFYNPTSSGITITNNGNTFTVNGTTTKKSSIGTEIKNWTPIIGHKILVSGCPEGGGVNTFSLAAFNQRDAIDYGNGGIGRVITTDKWFGILFESGVTFNNLVFKPQLFDLTEMYGAGNEPTTVEQFRQDFPEEMYDYKPYSTIPSYKKSLVCKTKNLFDINRLKGINYLDVYGNSLKCFNYATSVPDISVLNIFKSLKPNTIYTISATVNKYIRSADGRIALLFSNGSTFILLPNINQPGYSYGNFSLTQEQIDSIVALVFYGEDESVGGPIIWSNIQLELGDTATDYVSYGHL